jgi:hypothetical protein
MIADPAWRQTEAPDTATAWDALAEALDGTDWRFADDQSDADPRRVVLENRETGERESFASADAAHRFLLEEDGSFGPGGEEGGW